MADPFGIPQITSYIMKMGLKTAHVDYEREIVELAFHSSHGQWRMLVCFQQHGESRKLMLIAPHIGTVTTKRRLECLEALMSVNYRIAVGKFGLDIEDGEVRLEEAVPLGPHSITFEQFQLVFGTLMQTVAMYHSLLPRIIYGNLSVIDALNMCEQEFLQHAVLDDEMQTQTEAVFDASPGIPSEGGLEHTNIDLNDVLAEVTRIFEEKKEQ
ncbi:MAG: hypothetical protein NVSMB38_17140 [Ktedonobacteraceae bacterium]